MKLELIMTIEPENLDLVMAIEAEKLDLENRRKVLHQREQICNRAERLIGNGFPYGDEHYDVTTELEPDFGLARKLRITHPEFELEYWSEVRDWTDVEVDGPAIELDINGESVFNHTFDFDTKAASDRQNKMINDQAVVIAWLDQAIIERGDA